MAQEWAKAFYNSARWIKCRNSFIEERIMLDGGLCQECGTLPGYIVHHKVTLTQENINNPDVSLNFLNLEYVCKECHDRFEGHGVGRRSEKHCVFDEEGQPVSLREIDNPPLQTDGRAGAADRTPNNDLIHGSHIRGCGL